MHVPEIKNLEILYAQVFLLLPPDVSDMQKFTDLTYIHMTM